MVPRARTSIIGGLLIWLLTSLASAQTIQTAGERDAPATVWNVRNWTRVEWWRFFEPAPGGGDNDYAYVADRLQAGVTRGASRYAFMGSLQYVQFGNLPSDAVGPGPLGLGAVYFAHAGRSDSRQLYVRYLNLQVKSVLPGVAVQIGRMPYSSGAESTSGNPTIEVAKQQRVAAPRHRTAALRVPVRRRPERDGSTG
jgi:hypothetical protein